MEIRIDTKKDSREDIKKVISFLKKFVEESGSYEYGSSNNSDDFNIPATGMFDSPAPKRETEPVSKNEDYTVIEY